MPIAMAMLTTMMFITKVPTYQLSLVSTIPFAQKLAWMVYQNSVLSIHVSRQED